MLVGVKVKVMFNNILYKQYENVELIHRHFPFVKESGLYHIKDEQSWVLAFHSKCDNLWKVYVFYFNPTEDLECMKILPSFEV